MFCGRVQQPAQRESKRKWWNENRAVKKGSTLKDQDDGRAYMSTLLWIGERFSEQRSPAISPRDASAPTTSRHHRPRRMNIDSVQQEMHSQ